MEVITTMNDEEKRLLELAIEAGEARIKELIKASSGMTCLMCIDPNSPNCEDCPISHGEIISCGDYGNAVRNIVFKIRRQIEVWEEKLDGGE